MAVTELGPWMQEEWDSKVYMKIRRTSAAESSFRRLPMSARTKRIARLGDSTDNIVPKGSAYPEQPTEMDDVELRNFKFGKVERLDDEDLKDQRTATISTFQQNWASAHAVNLDNACLGTTGAMNGTTVPFESLYYALRHDDDETGYTADDNYMSTTAAAFTSPIGTSNVVSGYDTMSEFQALVEDGDYWDDANMLIIAHPRLRVLFRGMKNSQGDPMMVRDPASPTGYAWDGKPLKWSYGARTNATSSSKPSGNPLLFYVNSDMCVLGVRSGPEYQTAGPDTGAAFLTDQALLKMRSRRGYVTTIEQGCSVLEIVPETP